MKSAVFFSLLFIVLSSEIKAQVPGMNFENMPGMDEVVIKPEVKFVQLSTGIQMEYAEQGDASGLPVIFLHGFSDSWRSFELNLPYLPTHIHAFALSQRGHGNSDKPLEGYNPMDFANDVAAFMDKMKIKKAVIVGHSMGSTNARQFVISYPEKTMGLVLVGSFEDYKNNPSIAEFEGVLAQLKDPIDINFITEFQKSTIKRPVPDSYFATIVGESLKLPAHVWKGVALGWKDTDQTEKLKKLKLPTLIIWGDLDAYSPEKDQYVLRDAITDSKLEVYNGTGHAVQWEEPKRFADDLIKFVNGMKK